MISTVSRRKAITFLLVTISVIIMVCLWPLKLIRHDYTAKSDEDIVRESDPISVEYNMAQMFDGVNGELKSVDLYVFNDMSDQIMTFRLYDGNHEQIYEQFYNVPTEFVAPDFVHIPIRYEMEKGVEYSFIIEGLTTDLYCAYEDRATTTSPVNYFMAYGGAEVPEYDLVVRYNYACPYGVLTCIIVLLVLAIVCVGVWFVLGMFEDAQISIKRFVQVVVDPLLVISAIASLYILVIAKVFSLDTKNNLFMLLGVWILLGLIGLIVNLSNIAITADIVYKIKNISIGRIVRVISLATVLWYCYEYINGLYNIFHYYSTAKMCIAFAFLLFSTYSKKEVLNIPNAIWLVVGPIISYFVVYRPMADVELEGELYRLYAWLVVMGGFVLINWLYSAIMIAEMKIKCKEMNPMFAIPFAIFATGLIALANGRTWTWQFIILCVLLMHRLIVSKSRENFLKDLYSAVVLNFYMMVWFSLRHRPYYYFLYYRYYMGFHTVTVTAYYLALIASAAVMRLVEAYNKGKNLLQLLPRLFTVGMVMSYVLFTMSRTAFLSVGVMAVFGVCGMAVFYLKENKVKEIMRKFIIIFVATMCMFPVTFMLQGLVPRLVNDPITFEYEVRDFTFTEGMPIQSPNYITIEHFSREFGKKVFGITPKDSSARFDNPFVIKAYAADVELEEEKHIINQEIMMSEEEEDVSDMSNGRFDIFRSYIKVWNLWGHDDMSAELPDGEMAYHAHNTFLQVAHDHGVVYGAYFLLFIGYVMLLSLFRAFKHKGKMDYFYTPLVIVSFGMASLVEWVFHMCNPLGLFTFLAILPLIVKDNVNEKNN